MKDLIKRLEKVEENLDVLHRDRKMVSQELKMLGEGLIVLTENLTILVKGIGKLPPTIEASFGHLIKALTDYQNRMGDILEFIKEELEKDVGEET